MTVYALSLLRLFIERDELNKVVLLGAMSLCGWR